MSKILWDQYRFTTQVPKSKDLQRKKYMTGGSNHKGLNDSDIPDILIQHTAINEINVCFLSKKYLILFIGKVRLCQSNFVEIEFKLRYCFVNFTTAIILFSVFLQKHCLMYYYKLESLQNSTLASLNFIFTKLEYPQV